MTVSERSLRAKIAAHERWGRELDRTAATAAARNANADRYLKAAQALNPSLSETELLVRAANLRSADMTRLARARWTKNDKAATVRKSVTAQEVDRASDHTTARSA